jgi:Domain of unknown function (DUF6867)
MTDTLVLGTSFPVFFFVTVVMMGGCAVLAGRALARAWRPARSILPYALLLALTSRFLIFALFAGSPRAVWGFVIDLYVVLLAALISYRLTLVHQMVRQYPWLYERFMYFSWRNRRTQASEDLELPELHQRQ